MAAQGGEDIVDAAPIEFVAALFAPLVGEIGSRPVDALGDIGQTLLGAPAPIRRAASDETATATR